VITVTGPLFSAKRELRPTSKGFLPGASTDNPAMTTRHVLAAHATLVACALLVGSAHAQDAGKPKLKPLDDAELSGVYGQALLDLNNTTQGGYDFSRITLSADITMSSTLSGLVLGRHADGSTDIDISRLSFGRSDLDDAHRTVAIANPYFEWVGGQLGFGTVQKYAHLLGLGTPTGVNLPGETGGVFPVTMPSYAVPHMSSHADRITTSTMQLASLLSATVNGGVLYQPRVAPGAGYVPRERWRLPPNVALGALFDGFVSTVSEGSAIDAFDPELVIAGKTGTCAGVGWLASYAPAESPEVVLVVLTKPGNGHRSSDVAARIWQMMKPTLLSPEPKSP
jgi:hypothetical protein